MISNQRMLKISYIAILILGITLFTMFSAAAIFHVLMVITGIYFLSKNKDVKLSLSAKALLFVAIISAISVPINNAPIKYMFKVKYFVIGVLSIYPIFYLVKNYLNEKKSLLILNFFLIFSAIASASGLVGLTSGFNPLRFSKACHMERTCGMFGMYMSYGYGMGLFLILSIGLILFKNKIKFNINHKILYTSVIINFIGFYFSYARGALIGLVLGVSSFFLLKRPLITFKIILGSILLTAIVYFSSENFRSMIHTRTSSNQQRISLFQAAYYGFLEKPIFGVGYRNFEDQSVALKIKYNVVEKGVVNPKEIFAGSAHNNFLEHLVSTGILGFIGIVLFHLFWLFEMVKRNDLVGTLMIGFIVDLIISGQVEYTLGDGEILFLIMFVYALSQVQFRIEKNEIY